MRRLLHPSLALGLVLAVQAVAQSLAENGGSNRPAEPPLVDRTRNRLGSDASPQPRDTFQANSQIGPFLLPTSNRALFESGAEERFFVGTVGKPWTSGTFGCVRSEGWQFHEGLDIRCLQRDAGGEPVDPVLATANGTVVYFNKKSPLSNYGTYLLLRHEVEGIEIYSLYAHLRQIREDLAVGQTVRAGEPVAVMGRTTNTGQPISRDRAHVHFELNLFINERFPLWYKKAYPDQRNDHGQWNGLNLLGLDPRLILLEPQRITTNFSLVQLIRRQPVLCRAFVRTTDFPWLRRYPALVETNALAATANPVGYELHLNASGIPIRLIPRTADEMPGTARRRLLSVNEAEYRRSPCRKLVVQREGRWQLATAGHNLLELLTY